MGEEERSFFLILLLDLLSGNNLSSEIEGGQEGRRERRVQVRTGGIHYTTYLHISKF